MKTLLELYQQSLNEATYNIDSDVDLVYKVSGMQKFIETFKKSGYKGGDQYDNLKDFDSSILKCPQSVAAHKVNPIRFICAVGGAVNYYDMVNHKIRLSISRDVIDLYRDEYPTFDSLYNDQLETIKSELNEDRIKATIYHELSHWISDSLHNSHLTKLASKALDQEEHGGHGDMKLGKYNVGETYYEIDAQIHGIKQIKRNKTDVEWNSMTLNDLFKLYPSLNVIKNKLKVAPNDNELYDWIRALTTRMSREGLLGKNMTKFPSY